MIKKGAWVRIHKIVLEPRDRAPQVPEDTKTVPLELWVKGWLQKDAEIGKEAEILTRTGRKEEGTLLEENPTYRHGFGEFVPELLVISDQVRELVFGGGK
ncbi:2-amino-4-oxopentanoate thiolase subunit OrtA [Treponema primitia]|uniref:2-amino-4-oxopentanoate thiolase subunit OrtA n=1 Tax=Treponema primitia TaxID=88058 RepID=UPI0002554DD9|nr:2-amino-4-oxopentanoate thiolase subunit OrtA [Treponema primitia]